MCLAVPGEVKEIRNETAVIDFGGLKREADISLIDNIKVGEWVIVHAGFAIQKVDIKTAKESYRLLSEMGDF